LGTATMERAYVSRLVGCTEKPNRICYSSPSSVKQIPLLNA
jgi:hypothetical protein